MGLKSPLDLPHYLAPFFFISRQICQHNTGMTRIKIVKIEHVLVQSTCSNNNNTQQ